MKLMSSHFVTKLLKFFFYTCTFNSCIDQNQTFVSYNLTLQDS